VLRFVLAVAFLGVACSAGGNDASVLRDYSGSRFHPGQVWRYHARPGEDSSTLTVLKVERHPETGVIVHVRVTGVHVRTPGGDYASELGHLPISEDALRRSVTTKVRDGAPTDRGTDGYQEWRRAYDSGRGGVFTTTVSECVAFVEQAANQARAR
jgi:hypothetical protein